MSYPHFRLNFIRETKSIEVVMMNGTANYGDSEAKRKYWKRVYSKVAITNLPFLTIPIFFKAPKICGSSFIYIHIYFGGGRAFSSITTVI